MSRKGILAVVSGFSGAGKGTVMKEMMARYGCYSLSVSATTRKARPGEVDGREYFFVDDEKFRQMIAGDELLEYARYVDHFYGTPRPYIEAQMAVGKDVILEIEMQGALKVKEKIPSAVLIFIVAPSAAELRRRLSERGTEDGGEIERRLKRARAEADGMGSYDYIVVNDTVDECARQIHSIIQSQHFRVSENAGLIARMKAELGEA